VDKKMALNGSELINDPFNTLLSPFMDLFEIITGNGMNFWVLPLIGITLAIYIKNEYEPTMPMMFMIASGALLSSGSIFAGMPGIPYALIIFTAIGITGLFTSLYLGNKR